MAELEKIQQRIREIAESRNNVTVSDIDSVISDLGKCGFTFRMKAKGHYKMYTLDDATFSVCTHHPGQKQILPCYVREFLRSMIELGIYEQA
ncbi:MAG: hypothetical protein ABI811_00135 [Acidobacteriota bacterium]